MYLNLGGGREPHRSKQLIDVESHTGGGTGDLRMLQITLSIHSSPTFIRVLQLISYSQWLGVLTSSGYSRNTAPLVVGEGDRRNKDTIYYIRSYAIPFGGSFRWTERNGLVIRPPLQILSNIRWTLPIMLYELNTSWASSTRTKVICLEGRLIQSLHPDRELETANKSV